MSATIHELEAHPAPAFGANLRRDDQEVSSPDSMSSAGAVEEREHLLGMMRGARVRIPDMQCMMSHWPQGVHPEIGRLDEDVKQTLGSIFSSPSDAARLKKMNRSGVALFGASWWAYPSYEALKIATYLSIWLFAWDDETDSLEFSPLINDFEQSCVFRDETMSYLEASLSGATQAELDKISTNPIITNFKPVGQAIFNSCNQRQVDTFIDELRFFIKMSEEEQMFQMTPHLPTVEDYTRRRMGSSAVRVCLAITEYAYRIELPQHVMDDDAMQAIWDETNVIISTSNDILSIKKEVDQSQIDTLIPLLAQRFGSVQKAIDGAVGIVHSSCQRLELAEKQLLERYSSDPKLQADIRKFVDGSKYACTANLNWSLTSGRYKLNLRSMKGGIDVTL